MHHLKSIGRIVIFAYFSLCSLTGQVLDSTLVIQYAPDGSATKQKTLWRYDSLNNVTYSSFYRSGYEVDTFTHFYDKTCSYYGDTDKEETVVTRYFRSNHYDSLVYIYGADTLVHKLVRYSRELDAQEIEYTSERIFLDRDKGRRQQLIQVNDYKSDTLKHHSHTRYAYVYDTVGQVLEFTIYEQEGEKAEYAERRTFQDFYPDGKIKKVTYQNYSEMMEGWVTSSTFEFIYREDEEVRVAENYYVGKTKPSSVWVQKTLFLPGTDKIKKVLNYRNTVAPENLGQEDFYYYH